MLPPEDRIPISEGACRQRSAPAPSLRTDAELARKISDTLGRECDGAIDPEELLDIARQAVALLEGATVPNYVPILALKAARSAVDARRQDVNK